MYYKVALMISERDGVLKATAWAPIPNSSEEVFIHNFLSTEEMENIVFKVAEAVKTKLESQVEKNVNEFKLKP